MSSEATLHGPATLQEEPFQYAPAMENVDAAYGDESPSGGHNSIPKAQAEMQVKSAHERGLLEGEQRAKANHDAKVAALQNSIRQTVESFRAEREEYFNRIEPEVVQLSLAIARKILHRESQIDPLLLTGLVHVALEKLDTGTRVRLKVHPSDTHFWNELFARSVMPLTPELLGDPALQHGECTLETEVGSTQISLETQLKEIEQGFFDLLDQRPKVR